ncbi:MAG: restriction endonuclease subunit S [Sulfurovum sp.]|nr:MAG: restriction endonuclease subunit S [Sulfurovum sp.]
MSNKISIKELLEGVDVEWKSLGEVVVTITAPLKVKREAYCETGKTPIIDQGINFIAGYINEDLSIVPSDEYIVFGDHSEHIKYVNFSFVQGADGLKILKSKGDNTKFLYYAFLNFYQKEQNYKRHWTTAKETLIPIPEPEVQSEIVRILDNFTELTAELTAELRARKKQYSYYRDKLLTFEDGEVGLKPLDEVGELVRGNGLPKADFTEDGVPAIHYGQIYTYYGTSTTKTKSFVSAETAKKLRKVNKGDVVITNTSENLEDVGKALVYLGELEAVTGGHATIFKPNNEILGKYFTYYTQSSMFFSQKVKYAKGTKVIDVSATDLGKFKIPLPSLAEQEKIVSILDKFDILTNSISEGLPKEIELRQKQYEYYRDLLLSFPKKEVEA